MVRTKKTIRKEESKEEIQQQEKEAKKKWPAKKDKNSPFPDEVIVYILSFLSDKELCKVTSLVSKKWFVLSALDSIWEPLYWETFGDEEEEIEEDDEPSLWKNKYKMKLLEQRKKFQTEEPVIKGDQYHNEGTTAQVLEYLSPQECFSLAFDSYNQGCSKNEEEKYEQGVVLLKKAIFVLDKTFEHVEKEKDYPAQDMPKWICLLAECHICIGFSLRRLGYVTVAVQHYDKALKIAERFLAENKSSPIAAFAKEIIVTACKNYGVALNLLQQYSQAVEVYNKGVALLEEKVDIEHEQNKLNLKDVVNLLTYLTNRIFVLRHLKKWDQIAVDVVNITNCYLVYKREREQKLSQQEEVAEEYDIIDEVFQNMVQFQLARWPPEDQRKQLDALQKKDPTNPIALAMDQRLAKMPVQTAVN